MVKTLLVMSFLWLHIFPSVGENNKEKLPGYNEECSIMPYFPYIFLINIIKFNIRGRACRFSWVMGCNFQAGTWISSKDFMIFLKMLESYRRWNYVLQLYRTVLIKRYSRIRTFYTFGVKIENVFESSNGVCWTI